MLEEVASSFGSGLLPLVLPAIPPVPVQELPSVENHHSPKFISFPRIFILKTFIGLLRLFFPSIVASLPHKFISEFWVQPTMPPAFPSPVILA